MITYADIEKAADLLNGIIQPTPLIESWFFREEYRQHVYLKPENLQITGSFKIRGAYNFITAMNDEDRKKGVIASSAGNHAQGVAYAAGLLGVKATIVMPRTTPLIKVEATKKLGAEVILSGDIYDEAYKDALNISAARNLIFVHPFDDEKVIAGQGTIAVEILKDLPDCEMILVPVGGGGLISGIAIAAKHLNPEIKIVGIEPVGAATLTHCLEYGCVRELDKIQTIADGVAVKRAGDITFDIVSRYVDEIITVTDYDLMEAFLMLAERHKLIAENAAILSIAGLKKIEGPEKKIVSVISGGNIDVLTIAAMIDQGLLTRGRIFCFSVELPDKPGQLLKVAEILAEYNANVVKLDHNQFKSLDRLHKVHLEVTVETNGHEHINRIMERFYQEGYTIDKVY
ncbi:MAG: threonine ammonia-lyase [Spirochaetes bacterium]|nr:threonine ammonia-lyase [Spirochaetota bacterium]